VKSFSMPQSVPDRLPHGKTGSTRNAIEPNYAAKLTTLSSEKPTWITKAVHDQLSVGLRLNDSVPIWETWTWTAMKQHSIRSSTWELPIT